MAIINVTSDSFYAGSRVVGDSAIQHAVAAAIEQGADILDIGAVSTRPGSIAPPIEQEGQKLLSALEIIRSIDKNIPISIDTYRSEVIKQIHAKFGAVIINDISGGTLDENMLDTAASLDLPYIMGHIKGTPQTMNSQANYENLMAEITTYFVDRIGLARSKAVKDILIDPCFGFAKTTEHNFTLLKHYDTLSLFGLPILASLSRKSMIYKTLNSTPDDALIGTAALNWEALQRGAKILRVHDVAPARDVVKLWQAYTLAP